MALCPLFTTAQSDPPAFDYSTAITWSDHPALHLVPQSFNEASAVTILDERFIEYRKEGDKYDVYNTFHRIIRVRDDQGIEMFNKVYVLVHEGAEITDIRARTIQADGKVLDLTPDKIKSVQEDGNDYRLFAMDGVEKGCELEYYYVEKRPFYLFSSEFFQAAKVPIVRERFLLISPPELRFSAKGYNGFLVSPDTVIGDRRIIVGMDTDVVGLPDDEKYSYRDKFLKRVDFKLSYNMNGNAEVRLYTWKDFGKRAYAYYTTRSEKEEKALDAFVARIPPMADTSLGARIAAAEDFVKSQIDIDKKLTSSGGDVLLQVINTKTANEEGVIRLLAGVYDHLDIPYNFVVASDRDGIPLDPELENWDRADNILFFFPGTGNYLDPVEQALRYPYIAFNLGGSRGLFLKDVQIGNFRTAIALFAPVPLFPEDSSSENLEAEVRFSMGLDTLLVHARQILRGYAAASARPIYTFLPKDKQEEESKNIVKAIDASADISNVKVTNPKLGDSYDNKPLIVEADLRCPDMIESAGNRLLLKIGDLIGIQVQMYQEKPRQLPAEMDFMHREDRTLVVHIPDGYAIRNPKDLLSDVTYPGMGFKATYTLDGNLLTVQIREHYAQLLYPLSEFQDFQKVINASADFNKVVLVLEKAQ